MWLRSSVMHINNAFFIISLIILHTGIPNNKINLINYFKIALHKTDFQALNKCIAHMHTYCIRTMILTWHCFIFFRYEYVVLPSKSCCSCKLDPISLISLRSPACMVQKWTGLIILYKPHLCTCFCYHSFKSTV